jgi:hypothetical protein
MAETEKKDNLKEVTGKLEEGLDMESAVRRLGVVTVILSKTVTFCDETYTKLEMDFEGLTGKDMEAIDDELAAMGVVIPNPNINHKYQRILAARAAGVPSDMIEKLPLRDYQKITTAARSFLLATASI